MVYKYLLKGIDCPHCAGKIEIALLENTFILHATIDLPKQQLEIDVKSEDKANLSENTNNNLSKEGLFDLVTRTVHKFEPDVEVQEIQTSLYLNSQTTSSLNSSLLQPSKPTALKIKAIQPIKGSLKKVDSCCNSNNGNSGNHDQHNNSCCHDDHGSSCCHDEHESSCCHDHKSHNAHSTHNVTEHKHKGSCCCSHDQGCNSNIGNNSNNSTNIANAENTVVYYLRGLDCPHCSALIEGDVKDLPGVKDCAINLINGRISIVLESIVLEKIDNQHNSVSGTKSWTRADLFSRLEEIVHTHEPDVAVEAIDLDSCSSQESKEARIKEEQKEKQEFARRVLRLWGGGAIFAVGMLLFYCTDLSLFYVKVPIFVIAYIILGYDVILSAITSIGRGQVFNENFLMSISTLGAFGIQEFPEAVAVMFFFQLGEYFEDRAVNSSRKSIVGLMALKAEYANLKTPNGLEQIAPENVKVDDLIVIKPGERVPLDGYITEGTALADTVALTGESVPVSVHPGDEILSGTIINDSAITVRVSKIYRESTVARIIDLVENSASRKSKAESFISKFARYYTPLVVIAAVFVALCPPLLFAEAWSTWLNRAFVFLVISCPCALVISVPLTFFGGIGAASRKGILIKGSNYLEALNNVDSVVFDKTGTLTKGVFKVVKIIPAHTALSVVGQESSVSSASSVSPVSLDSSVSSVELKSSVASEYLSSDESFVASVASENSFTAVTDIQLLTYAAYAEVLSNHPIAKSIMKAAIESGVEVKDELVSDYSEISGHGISVKYDNKNILAGNTKLMDKFGISYTVAESEGTIVYVACDNKFIGSIAISDELKTDAIDAISKLKELGVSKTVMLTGDRKEIAEVVAKKLNIDEYHAELLPVDKVTKLEELDKNKAGNIVFVGDGINDAPVLARADIGIAMGALGSEAAAEAADIVLMNDEPSKVADAISIAAKTRSIVIQNIVLALGVKILLLILGLFGIVGLWTAVFGDVGVMVLAVFNAMRMLRIK